MNVTRQQRRFWTPPLVTAGRIGILGLALAVGTARLGAQGTGAARPAPPPAPQAATAPPVINFPSDGISLEEAVRLTLEHDPGIKKSQANIQQRQGAAQEQAGAFDYILSGAGSYTRRVQELSQGAKDEQTKKRTDLDNEIAQNAQDLTAETNLVNILNQVKALPPGSQQVAALANISPTIAGTLQVLDNLLSSSTLDPGVKASLQATRNQFLSDTISQANTQLAADNQLQAAAQQNRADLGTAPIDEVFIDGSLSFTLNKVYRTGISFAPFVDGTFLGTNYKDKPASADFGGKGLPDIYSLHAGVNMGIPLLRGRGRGSAGAPERAALLARDASQLQLQHQNSQSVLATVLAYWDLRAAQEALDIANQSVDFQTQLLTLSRRSIAAGELPQAELARAQASEARARGQVESASADLHRARVALATALGVAVSSDDASLPHARDDFPQSPESAGLPSATAATLTQAQSDRHDLGAAAKTEEAQRTLADAAKLDLQPRLDLTAGAFFTALDEGNFMNAANRWVGPSTNTAFQFEKPLGNNTLKGQLLQREAEAEQGRIAQADLARQIKLGVLDATNTLRQTVARVQQAQAAVGFYQTMIDAETNRFRTGDATLIDTILTQEQQITARLTLVSARHDLAQQVAQLRFQTGTLVTGGAVRAQDLVTVPAGVRSTP